MTGTVDANGAIHASSTGRFSGHLQGEGDADAILAAAEPATDATKVRKSRFPTGEELRRLVAEQEAAERAAARHKNLERLAVLRAAVVGIELPTEPHPSGLTRAFEPEEDPAEAIASTIAGPFRAQPGILWIFTNNRNSPGNDPDTVKRNREFYDLVHVDPSITRSLAFPLKMPVEGAHYQATGLMVYALAYGEPAAAHDHHVAW